MTWLPEYLSDVLWGYHLTILRKTPIILTYCSLRINSLLLKIVERKRSESSSCNLLHILPWDILLSCTFQEELLPVGWKLSPVLITRPMIPINGGKLKWRISFYWCIAIDTDKFIQ